MQAVRTFIEERQNSNFETDEPCSVIYYSDNSQIVAKFEPVSKVLNVISKAKPDYGGTIFYTAIDEVYKILNE